MFTKLIKLLFISVLLLLIIYPVLGIVTFIPPEGSVIYPNDTIIFSGLTGSATVRFGYSYNPQQIIFDNIGSSGITPPIPYNDAWTSLFFEDYTTNKYYFTYDSNISHHPLVVNFTISNTSGYSPLYEIVNDTSIGGIIAWHWDITLPDGEIWQSDNKYLPELEFVQTGYHSIKLTVSDNAGSGNLTKYVLVMNGTINPITTVYTVSINPSTISPNNYVTETILSSTGNISDLKFIKSIDYTNYPSNTILNVSSGYSGVNFLKINGIWQHYTLSGYEGNDGTLPPNNYQYNFITSGSKIIKTTLIDNNDNEYNIFNTVIVTGNVGQSRLTIYPIDYNSGAFVSGSRINLRNPSGIWDNRTVLIPSDCAFLTSTGFYNYVVYAPIGSNYNASNQGALTTVSLNLGDDKIEYVKLIPNLQPENNTQTIMFIGVVSEPNLVPVESAIISIPSINLVVSTSQSGIAVFNLTRNENYAMTVTKTGYKTSTVYFTAEGDTDFYNVVLETGSGVITYVTTAIPTTIITFITPVGANQTVTCSNLTVNATFLDLIKHSLACSGVQTQGNQNLVIALLIIIVCGVVLGKYGKGIGALAGIIAGFVISTAMQLIPVWVLIAAIILAGIVIAIKMTGGTE